MKTGSKESDVSIPNNYRELEIGERILEGDVFVQGDKVYSATDIGNGIYSKDHYPHYREIPPKESPENGE